MGAKSRRAPHERQKTRRAHTVTDYDLVSCRTASQPLIPSFLRVHLPLLPISTPSSPAKRAHTRPNAMPSPTGQLVPPLFERGAAREFARSGRTLSFTGSPRDTTYAVFASPNVKAAFQSHLEHHVSLTVHLQIDPQSSRTSGLKDQQIYLAGVQEPPRSERRVVRGIICAYGQR